MAGIKKIVKFKIVFFLAYYVMGLAYCLLISYMIGLGYTALQRSTIFALGAILSMVSQILIGYLCDKNRTIKRYTQILCVLFAVIGTFVYFYQKPNYIYHLLVITMLVIVFRNLMGIYDSWALESGTECYNKYGIIRAYGSFGWAVGSLIAGAIVEISGYKLLTVTFLLTTILLLLMNKSLQDAIKQSTAKLTIRSIASLLKNNLYIIIIIAIFFVNIMMNAADLVIVDKIEVLGGGPNDVSLFWAVTAAVELPLFLLGNKIEQKYGAIYVFTFATIVYGIRFLLYGFASSVTMLLIVSLLQGLTFPLSLVTTKVLIDNQSPVDMRSSGQQVAMSFYSSLSALMAPLMAGFLEDTFNIDVAIKCISLASILALVFIAIYIKKEKMKVDVS